MIRALRSERTFWTDPQPSGIRLARPRPSTAFGRVSIRQGRPSKSPALQPRAEVQTRSDLIGAESLVTVRKSITGRKRQEGAVPKPISVEDAVKMMSPGGSCECTESIGLCSGSVYSWMSRSLLAEFKTGIGEKSGAPIDRAELLERAGRSSSGDRGNKRGQTRRSSDGLSTRSRCCWVFFRAVVPYGDGMGRSSPGVACGNLPGGVCTV